MAGKRSYTDPCGVARALDDIGERWALLVVRELLFGPKRFSDLSRGLPGMSQNVLAQRLRELEGSGVVTHRKLGPPASTRVYELTAAGYQLREVVVALARWGSRRALPAGSAVDLSVDALALALLTTFDPGSSGGERISCELRLGDDRFHAEIEDDEFTIDRGPAPRPDTVLETDPITLRDLVFLGLPLDEAERAGTVRLTGDRKAAKRFLASFPRPTPFEDED